MELVRGLAGRREVLPQNRREGEVNALVEIVQYCSELVMPVDHVQLGR